jgi:hypothetical protein
VNCLYIHWHSQKAAPQEPHQDCAALIREAKSLLEEIQSGIAVYEVGRLHACQPQHTPCGNGYSHLNCAFAVVGSVLKSVVVKTVVVHAVIRM